MPTQKFTKQDIDQLSAWFQRRREAAFSWKTACAGRQFLPGSRAFYPMSAVGTAGEARDLAGSGQVYDLTNNNVARFRYTGLYSWCDLNGTTQYFNFADNANFDILGTEGYISPAARGLALYAWAYFDAAPGATEYIVAKWLVAGGQKSYRLIRTAAGNAEASISVDGVANTTVVSTQVLLAGTWYCLALQYDPSAKLSVWIDGVETSNAVAIPASIFNSTADFTLGAEGTPAAYMDGRMSLVSACAEFHDDYWAKVIYESERALFEA